jgi:hypothetical protein
VTFTLQSELALYSQGVFKEWAAGTQCQIDVDEMRVDVDEMRELFMLLSVESKIGPETEWRAIVNSIAVQIFNQNWPENAGIHQVNFGKLLQKALNNPRDPKRINLFDDAHMQEALQRLDSGRDCWPLITEKEEKNCRMVAEIVVIATAVLLRSIEDQHGRHEKSLNGMPIDTNKIPSSKDIRRFAQGENFSVIEGYDIDKMVSDLEEIEAADAIARAVVADTNLVAGVIRAGIPPR